MFTQHFILATKIVYTKALINAKCLILNEKLQLKDVKDLYEDTLDASLMH